MDRRGRAIDAGFHPGKKESLRREESLSLTSTSRSIRSSATPPHATPRALAYRTILPGRGISSTVASIPGTNSGGHLVEGSRCLTPQGEGAMRGTRGHRVLGVVNEDRRIPERVHAFEIRDFESTLSTMRYSTPRCAAASPPVARYRGGCVIQRVVGFSEDAVDTAQRADVLDHRHVHAQDAQATCES